MKVFKGVILDRDSLHPSDLELSPLMDISAIEWHSYANSRPSETVARIANADIVLSNKVLLGAKEIDAAARLKYIGVLATGTNIIDHQRAQQRGIIVNNCTAYGTASVVQHTWALILALSTRLQSYQQGAQQNWGNSPFFCLLDYPITELAGKTLGIIGYGELGRGVANIGRAFGMEIIAGIIPGRPAATRQAPHLPLPELLSRADVISLHCPLSEYTRDLITTEQFALMKTSSLLINCARGGIVNEPALAEALIQGSIAGAGIDVLTREPPVDGNALLKPGIPNLIITPHCAWGSREARQRLVDQAGEKLRAFISTSHQ